MRFKEYLTEEYLMRIRSFEIFKNPERKEIQDLSKLTKGRIRVLVDEKDKKTWYMFSANLLHQYATEAMIEEKQISKGKYRAGEVFVYPEQVSIWIYNGTYTIKNNKSTYSSTDYNKEDYRWLMDRFKFFNVPVKYEGQVDEEYFTRSGKWEIFKNPDRKEIRTALTQTKVKGLRFLLTKDLKDLYVANASMLHGNMAMVIADENGVEYNRDYEDIYFPLEAEYDDSYDKYILELSIVGRASEKEKEDIIKNFKQRGFAMEWKS